MAFATLSIRPLVPDRPRLVLVRETPPPYGADHAGGELADPADFDHIEELGDAIATLSAHIEAATHRLLVLIAEFDEQRGWESSGQRSCAHWLAFRTGIDLGAARERVRTARVLVGLPEISAAMAKGQLSFSKVRALSRVATTENEGELLELARGATTAQLERVVRGWKRAAGRADEAALERDRHEARTLAIFPDLDGMYVVRGKLPPELGVLLMRAIEAASDQIYREQPVEALETEQAAAQRRADALALLAERAMAAGLGDGPLSGTRAERYQVVLRVDEATLQADGEPGRSDLDDGTRVSAETSRRLSCDVGLVRMRHGPDGRVLDVGRRTRIIAPALRRALEARDRGCRFPGCGSRFTDGHHCATGPMEARPASETPCSSAGTITRSCTRGDGPSNGGAKGGPRSSVRGVRASSKGVGSRPSCRRSRSRRSWRSIVRAGSSPTGPPLGRGGSGRRISRSR